MKVVPFELESEPYSKYGNISADGISKLLGTPHHDRLEIVLRESVQNSWDARLNKSGPVKYSVNLRELNPEEQKVLQETVFINSAIDSSDKGALLLEDSLKKAPLTVLEISDFGTSGLCGPEAVSDLNGQSETTDFIDFFRNIGTPRDKAQGGGTYGYGKSSFYALSRCGTILTDSLTTFSGATVRRVMAARISNRFSCSDCEIQGQYTGRHWWGHYNGKDVLVPVTGPAAEGVSTQLGCPERNSGMFGTTIMVIDPILGMENKEFDPWKIVEILLWNFWPKLMRYSNSDPNIEFEVNVWGDRYEVPEPDNYPPLNLFAEAMRSIKENRDVKKIQCKRPKKDLGDLSIFRHFKSHRHRKYNAEKSILPDISHHVALMRPAELVVKYLEGPAIDNEKIEWAGVFIADSDPETERAFADAEPPAHDDWNPNFLPDGSHAKTFVRVALRQIKKSMQLFVKPELDIGEESSGVSLGSTADKLGGLIAGFGGQRLGGAGESRNNNGNVPGTSGGSVKQQVSIKGLKFTRHKMINETPALIYEFQAIGTEGISAEISAKVNVIMEGGGITTHAPNGKEPEVLLWFTKNDKVIGRESTISYNCKDKEKIYIAVSIPDYVAVSLDINIREQSDAK